MSDSVYRFSVFWVKGSQDFELLVLFPWVKIIQEGVLKAVRNWRAGRYWDLGNVTESAAAPGSR